MTQGGYPGIGRATAGFVAALARAATGHTLLGLHNPDRPLPAGLPAAFAPPHRLVPVHSRVRAPTEQLEVPLRLRQCGADLYHATYYATALRRPCPTVLSLYDLIPERYPQYWRPPQSALIRAWLRAAARGAARIAVPSEAAADLHELYGMGRGRLVLAPLAADAAWLDIPSGEFEVSADAPRRPYLLCVCTNKPHKNLPRLVEAYALACGTRQDFPTLVIAGGWEWRYPQAREIARGLGLNRNRPEGGQVRFVHGPDDRTLRGLYRGALGFVYPSEYEGFGLTVLEALHCGLPLAASTTPAVAEVAGGACIPFDPEDVPGMARAIARLVEDRPLRDRLAAAGTARSRTFSWETTARALLRAYEEALRH